MAADSPHSETMPKPDPERPFWLVLELGGGLALAMFGAGIFALIESHYVWGGILTLLGLTGAAGVGVVAWRVEKPPWMMLGMAALTVLTWTFLGSDLYLHYAQPITVPIGLSDSVHGSEKLQINVTNPPLTWRPYAVGALGGGALVATMGIVAFVANRWIKGRRARAKASQSEPASPHYASTPIAVAPAKTRDQDSTRRKNIDTIRFDYLPDSPLNHGWRVAYGNVADAKWSTGGFMSDTIALEMNAGCAIELRLEPGAALADSLSCFVKYKHTAAMSVRVQLVAIMDQSRTTEKLIKYVIGKEPPFPTKGYEEDEWTLPIVPEALSDGWRRLDVGLPGSVERTWEKLGWKFARLLTIRLRGSLSISPIKLYQSEPTGN